MSGCGLDPERPSDGRDAIREVREPGPALDGAGIEAAPSSSTTKQTRPSASLRAIVTAAPGPACLAAFWRPSRQQK